MPAPKGNKFGKNGGRPTKYTEELVNGICDRVATSSDGLRKICKEFKIDYVQIKRWLRENEDFRTRYRNAKEDQAEHTADEMNEITDMAIKRSQKGVNQFKVNAFVNAVKLKVNTMQWIASKLSPKKYGERMDVNQTIRTEQPLFPDIEKDKD